MRMPVRLVIAALSYASVLALFASMDFGDRGFHFQPDRHAEAATDDVPAASPADDYDLRDLKLLTKCVGYIRNNYVDPSRVDPRQMLLASLEDVQRGVAELLVEPARRDTGEIVSVRVTVDKSAQEFRLDRVDDLYEMTWKLRDIFEFVNRHLPSDVSRADIEYAAVNGMLSTLDPHSILLAPEVYDDTKVGTTGKFGGLGIIISNRNGDLTIVTVLRDTPAWESGVKKGDRIVQIDEESTVNMTLNDAVNRLRGEVDTDVTVLIARDGWKEPRPFRITRREIKIESVQSRDVGQGVGYVRIKNFQANTFDDLEAHMRRLEEQGSLKKGLVLDLRDDPGGLLEQAIKVSDAFLSSGTIVTTVAQGARTRDEKKATQAGTRDELPLVVLVNNGSASASEIVTGALKNNNRAVVVGDQTFGKGSVQVLYELKDERGREAALKLTIAQYLTPGDQSIQSVGVVPDIETYPVTIETDDIDLYVSAKDLRGEKDLDNHLEHARAKAGLPVDMVKYYVPPEQESEDGAKEDEAAKEYGEIEEDYLIGLGRDLLVAAGTATRKGTLERAKPFLEKTKRDEGRKIRQQLEKLDVNWTASKTPETAKLVATLRTEPASGVVKAGDELKLIGTVTNQGKTPVHRVHAMTDTENGLLDNREFVYGLLLPGETREWTIPVSVPQKSLTRRDPLSMELYVGEKATGESAAPVDVEVRGLERPLFAYTWQVDDEQGNGDGLLQAGESINLVVAIKNIGDGDAYKTRAYIKNQSGKGVYLTSGKQEQGKLAKGESARKTFKLRVKKGIAVDEVELELSIVDMVLREFVTDTIRIPLSKDQAKTVQPLRQSVAASTSALIRGGAGLRSPTVARVAAGATLAVVGKLDGWYKVRVGEGQFGWISGQSVSVGGAELASLDPTALPATGQAVPVWQIPPRIEIDSTSSEVLTTKNDTFRLEGRATFDQSEGSRRYVYVFRNDKKVWFKSAPARADEPVELEFDASVPLEKGINSITIFARSGKKSPTQRTLLLHRL